MPRCFDTRFHIIQPLNRKRIIYFTYLDPNIVLSTIHIERLRIKYPIYPPTMLDQDRAQCFDPMLCREIYSE